MQPGHVATLLVDGDEQVGSRGPQGRTQPRQLVRVDDVRGVEAHGREAHGILPLDPGRDGRADESGHERADSEAPQRLS